MVKSNKLIMEKLRKHGRRRRTRRRRIRSSTSIPLDLMIEIFTRLPAKSLMRFKCLSKQYASIIESQNFIDSFFSYSSMKPHVLFLFSKVKELVLYSATMVTLNSGAIEQDPHSTVAVHVMTIPGNGLRIRTPSVRGLICYTVRPNQHVICNPATRQLFPLPQNKAWKEGDFLEYLFFGYEPISNRFKVISMLANFRNLDHHQFWIFTVGDGVNTWRKIKDSTLSSSYRPSPSNKPFGMCVDGVLYYKVRINPQPEVEDDTTILVVSFDLKSEKLSLIKLPPDAEEVTELIDFQGKLAFVDHTEEQTRVCVWVLEDAEKHKWSPKMYDLHYSVDSGRWFYERSVASGVCEGEIVFVPPRLFGKLFTWNWNLEKKAMKIVDIDIPSKNHGGCLEQYSSTIHVDNLVSL